MENQMHSMPSLEGKLVLFEGKEWKSSCFLGCRKANLELVLPKFDDEKSKKYKVCSRRVEAIVAIKAYIDYHQQNYKKGKLSPVVKEFVFSLAERLKSTYEELRSLKNKLSRNEEKRDRLKVLQQKHEEQQRQRGTLLFLDEITGASIETQHANTFNKDDIVRDELEHAYEKARFTFDTYVDLLSFFDTHFNVKVGISTLRNWLQYGQSSSSSSGRPMLLPAEAERNVAKIVVKLDASGCIITREVVQQLACDILGDALRQKMVGTTVGKKWYKGCFEVLKYAAISITFVCVQQPLDGAQ